jgi:hypothetical protein
MAAARSRIATALAALGVLVAVSLAGDHGAARAAVGQATGPLIGSSIGSAAILVTEGLAPGHVRVGEVTVTNVGDASGAFSLGSTGLADTPLSRELDLVVQDVTPGGASPTVYYGKLAALSSVALGTLAQGEAHRYRFSVLLPSDAGNGYQGASSAVTFTWSATAPDPVAAAAPAPAPTTEAPPPAVVTGGVVRPRATLSASARQSAKHGTVAASIACEARCRAVLSGTATDGHTSYKLPAVRRTLSKAGRTSVRIVLPRRARAALSAGRAITVRLRLTATIGQRSLVVRRTVRVAAPRR